MNVEIVPVFQDNLAYLLIDVASKRALAVDAAEPQAVKAAAVAAGVELAGALTTHKHSDHSAGNNTLAKEGVPVYALESEQAPGVFCQNFDRSIWFCFCPFFFLF